MRMSGAGHIWVGVHLYSPVEQAVRMDKESVSAKKHCEKHHQKPCDITRTPIHTDFEAAKLLKKP